MNWNQESESWRRLWPQIYRKLLSEFRTINIGIKNYLSYEIKEHVYNGGIIADIGSSRLIEYGGDGIPIVFVPSLINKPKILDLSSDKSFLKDLSRSNLKPYLLDWGAPTREENRFNISDYIINRLLPFINIVRDKHRKKPILAGYCMGGIAALAASILQPNIISGLVTIAMPWDFDVKGFTKVNTDKLMDIFRKHETISAGIISNIFYLSNFQAIDRKYIKFAANIGSEEILVESWVNDGVNLTKPVFEEFLNLWINKNGLMQNTWGVDGITLDVSKIKVPILSVVAKKDKVVPYASSIAFSENHKNVNNIVYDTGHIGMIINNKYGLINHLSNYTEGHMPIIRNS
jgi:polyhydroxyalkanoate synthase subunit PhaC